MPAPSGSSAPSDDAPGAAPAAAAGAFWHLADDFRPYLKVVAARLLGSNLGGKADASDVVQQALLEAFEHRADFRGKDAGAWRGWVVGIVKNRAFKEKRFWHQERRDVGREEPLAARSGCGTQPVADSTSPSGQAARRELAARLLALLEKLDRAEYREVIRLRNLEDLPFAEVAARMGQPETKVRVWWVRAVKRLRDAWGTDP
jgi:RNA polymerase sigma-70 factor (ECF subfamily)